ncbi:MAG TPA: adenosine deaminase, partial [Chthoniobacterales bacterium]|nr:adenosine deaminase [Chthoniobacterales bacterium]
LFVSENLSQEFTSASTEPVRPLPGVGVSSCTRVALSRALSQMPSESRIDPTLPFIDLHRHLDGNVRLETILDLARQHKIELPATTVEELRPYAQVTEPQPGLMAFIGKMLWATRVLADGEACRRVARENVEDAKREGIDYIELRFSPWFMAEPHRLNPEEVIEGVITGIAEGVKATGVRVNLIGILSRTYGADIASKELAALLAHREHFIALDLAGDEANFPAPLFVEHFKKGRDAGWRVTVHAGEAGGSQSVWDAIRLLGAERIGHGVRALEDPKLADYLAENRVPIEANLTSNVHTSTVTSLAAHPLREMMARGLVCSINTDDPGVSGIDLEHEFEVAAPGAGLSREQIRQAQINAVETAFLSEDEKRVLREKRLANK